MDRQAQENLPLVTISLTSTQKLDLKRVMELIRAPRTLKRYLASGELMDYLVK